MAAAFRGATAGAGSCRLAPRWEYATAATFGRYVALGDAVADGADGFCAVETLRVDAVARLVQLVRLDARGRERSRAPLPFAKPEALRLDAVAPTGAGAYVVAGAERCRGCVSWNGRTWLVGAVDAAGTPRWADRSAGGDAADGEAGEARVVVADGRGGAVAAGVIGTPEDWRIVAYGPGGVPRWSDRYPGPAGLRDVPMDLAVDADGNVTVVGWHTTSSALDTDWVLRRYTPDGKVVWTRTAGVAGLQDRAEQIALGPDGLLAVSGLVEAPPGLTDGEESLATCKLGVGLWDRDGRQRWMRTLEGTEACPPRHDLGFDGQGRVVVARFTGPGADGSPPSVTVTRINADGSPAGEARPEPSGWRLADPRNVRFLADGAWLLVDRTPVMREDGVVAGAGDVLRAVTLDPDCLAAGAAHIIPAMPANGSPGPR